MLKKVNDEWCVFDKEGIKNMGCHPTEEEAQKQLMAIEASKKEYEQLHTLEGVEIFATGVHNGDTFTETDLDSIVEAFNALDYKPPLKQGHRKDIPGEPALGYVSNLRRMGTKLVSDFVHIPTVVMDALKRKSYDRVSSEIYFDLKRGNTTHRRALKAVALLGADIPAVAGLAPISSLFGEITAVAKAYEFNTEEETKMSAEKLAALETQVKNYEEKLVKTALENETAIKEAKIRAEAAEKQLADLNKNYTQLAQKQREETIKAKVEACVIPAWRPMLTHLYDVALDVPVTKEFAVGDKKLSAENVLDSLVTDINAKAEKLFKEAGHGSGDREQEDNPAMEVHRLTKEFQDKNKESSYSVALKAVLAQNPALAQQYSAAN